MSWRCPLPALCDHGVFAIALVLLTLPAIAVGGVADGCRPAIQLGAAALGLGWSVRAMAKPPAARRSLRLSPSARWATALAVLLVVPLLPLPPVALRLLSPHAFRMFAQGLPGWPEARPFAALAVAGDESAPVVSHTWRALAVVPSSSAATLWLGLAYVVVGSVVAFYPWRDGGRPMLHRLVSALIALGVFEAGYAFLQQAQGLHRILWFECLEGTSCTGTYLNRNHFAGLLEMILPLTLARLGWGLSRGRWTADGWRDRLRQWADFRIAPVALAAVALILLVGLAISSSRSAFVVTVGSLAVMASLRPHGVYPAGRMRLRGVSLLLVMVAAIWLTFPQLRARLSLEDPTRLALAADAAAMAKDFPISGVGLGNFDVVYPTYRSRTVEMWGFPVDHAHNDYLEWLSEVGVPAALLSFALLCQLGARAVRRLALVRAATADAWMLWGMTTAVLALLLHSLTDFNLHVPANALIFAALVGGIVRLTRPAAVPAASSSPRSEAMRGDAATRCPGPAAGTAALEGRGDRRPAPQSRVPRLLAATAMAICLGWAILASVQWRAEAAFRRVYPDVPLRDLTSPQPALAAGEALRLVRCAAVWAPALPYVQAGIGRLLLQQVGRDAGEGNGAPDGAVRAFERSLTAAPIQPRTLLDLAAAAEAKGRGEGAVPLSALDDLVRRAAALAPYDPEVRLRVADWYVRRWPKLSPGQRRQAAAQVESALALAARAPELAPHRRTTLAAYERVRAAERGASDTTQVRLRPARGAV